MADAPYPANPSGKFGTVNNISVATTSTAAASAAFGSETYQIRVAASAACFLKVSLGNETPTAAATDAFLPAGWIEYVKVTPGQKISAFSATIQTISVVELTQ